MATADNIGIGFIGAGMVANLHAQAVARCRGATLHGLWNRSAPRAQEKAAAFGCRRYATVDELLADPGIDAVHVLTNLETHRDLTLQALAAGKHVLVEKPVGTSVAQIEEMRDAAAAAGLICMPGHNYIYEDGVRRTHELLQSGALGRLVSLHIIYNIEHAEEIARLFPGVVRQMMTHHAYILLYLAGRATELTAMQASLHYQQLEREDIAMATVRMASGALAHLDASFAADDHSGEPWTMLIKAIGTEGATRYSYRDWVQNKPADAHSQTYSAYPYTIANAVEHFVRYIGGDGPPPLSSMDDALAAQRIIEAVEQSVAERRVVELP